MGGSFLVFAVVILYSTIPSSSLACSLPRNKNIEYIKRSCYNTTLYPRLCYHTLAIYASTIKTDPKLLVTTALKVSVKATNSTSRLVKRVSKIPGLKPIVVSAMLDCVEEVGDSVYELRKSIEEMGHVGGSNFTAAMADIETWVSAALTDDTTCMDGYAEGPMNQKLKTIVTRHVQRIGRLTSNALALVNRYAGTQPEISLSP